jgi:hypothetical protein
VLERGLLQAQQQQKAKQQVLLPPAQVLQYLV